MRIKKTKSFCVKLSRICWQKIVHILRNKKIYPYIYISYWHYLINNRTKSSEIKFYYSVTPNPGAGIGHQMANWIAGYWFAKELEIEFAHIPFSTETWDEFLGFGQNEVKVKDLIEKQGYKKVRLPLFYENNKKEISLINKIISSYYGRKIVFVSEQDQAFVNQYKVMNQLKSKFYNATSRKNEKVFFDKGKFNIAVHVRRGDITEGQQNRNPNLLKRWQDIDYFVNVLNNVLKELNLNKSIAIYIFSQGKLDEFQEFNQFENVNLCLDLSAQESFLHMVYADLLITSKSSFSYKPALLSNGIKICPRNFWHGYPETNDWILAEEDGSIEMINNKIWK